MQKILNFLNKTVQIIFIAMMALMLIYNFTEIKHNFTVNAIWSVILCAVGALLVFMYKRRILDKKIIISILILLMLFGVFLRIYYISTTKINLDSDYEYYNQIATALINGEEIPRAESYTSYNGYAFAFASVLALVIKIFGTDTSVVLYFNLFIQIISAFVIYKSINIKYSKIASLLGATLWFLMPATIFATLLYSTETLFMLPFLVTIYLALKVIYNKYSLKKNIVYYVLLGIMASLANTIRPVMTVFILAFVISEVLRIDFNSLKPLKLKKLVGIVPVITMLVMYVLTNSLVKIYEENGIGTKLKAGALEWSIFYGANYETAGEWCPEDADILEESIANFGDGVSKVLLNYAMDRYKEMGPVKMIELANSKFKNLWANTNANYLFVDMVVAPESKVEFKNKEYGYQVASTVYMIILCFAVVIIAIKDFRNKNYENTFLQVFSIGYVLSNVIVVLNGRYSYPLFPIIIILAMQIAKYIKSNKDENVTCRGGKIEDVKGLVIVPAFNEEENINETYKNILNAKKDLKYPLDILVINDGSTDSTENVCKQNGIPYVSHIENLGLGSALYTGYKYAYENGYNLVIQIDGDDQHDAKCIDKLASTVIAGNADFVVGSRLVDNTSDYRPTGTRKLGISLLSDVTKLCTGKRIYDITSGYRVANRLVVEEVANENINIYPESTAIVGLVNNKFKVAEIGVKMHERKKGKSSLNLFKGIRYVFTGTFATFVANLRGGK